MKDLVNILRQKNYKILLIGDVCVDNYIYGSVDRISPEAPIPVLTVDGRQDYRNGMSANVRKNLEALQCHVKHIRGNQSVKTRYIDSKTGYQLLRVDNEVEQNPLTMDMLNFQSNIYDAVVISDYDKGFISYDIVKEIRDAYCGPIFIDTKKKDLRHFENCFVKINRKEHTEATSLPSLKNLVITLGADGTLHNGQIYPTDSVEVHDVTGAGDVHLAALAVFYLNAASELYGIDSQLKLSSAILYANKLASISVQHRGVYTLTEEDINSIRWS